jgi:beta-glucosidase
VAVVVSSLAAATPVSASQPRASCPWVGSSASPLERANQVVARMTLDEKIIMVHGNGNGSPYAGRVPAISRLCVPSIALNDGPNGVAGGLSQVTQLPAPVAAAATWDTGLVRRYGEVEGAEQKTKGASVALAPMVNIVRDPRFGRAFETYSEDPYLASRLGVADIQGIQSQGVMAQVKHLAAYNQETNRNGPSDNAVVDERTLQEVYLPAFDAAIHQGGAASVMCSYNYLNGMRACEDPYLLKQVLRDQWGFDGFLTSDWGAVASTENAARNGLDQQMPDGDAAGLKAAVQAGRVPLARLDDMVRHILTQMFRFGLFESPIVGDPNAPAATAAHATVARQVAEQSAVLLKNSDGVLPLDPANQHSIAVIGQPARDRILTTDGLGNPVATPGGVITPYDAIKARAGSGTTVTYTPGGGIGGDLPTVPTSVLTPDTGTGSGLTARYYKGTDPTGSTVLRRVEGTPDVDWQGRSPGTGVPATSWSASWTGTITPPASGRYRFTLDSDDGSRLFVGGSKIIENWHDQGGGAVSGTVDLTAGESVPITVEYYQAGGDSHLHLGWQPPGASPDPAAVAAARAADVAVVFVASTSGEGSDLGDIDLPGIQNDLVSEITAVNPHTVVVVQSGSAVTMPWLDSAAAVLEDWFPGQAIGPALAGLLFGDVNPSGKLPVTFPVSLADVPAHTAAQWPGQNNAVQYSEGIDVGYRWYDRHNVDPMFPFGFGLSYTSFRYANLAVGPPDGDGNVAVSFDVTNTGSRAGAEVAQVYVGQPAATGESPKNLRGFGKVTLSPGQTRRVTVTLDARSFQSWTGSWTTTAGSYQILVGASSRDVRLTGAVTLGGSGLTPLPRTGWTVTASPSSTTDVPARMIDGDTGTRWSSGTAMANGNTVTVDLGAARRFSRVVMDSADSANDYARGYQLAVSANGTTWTTVGSGSGTGAVVTADFPVRTARYLRITQTGSATWWWSIAELNLFG